MTKTLSPCFRLVTQPGTVEPHPASLSTDVDDLIPNAITDWELFAQTVRVVDATTTDREQLGRLDAVVMFKTRLASLEFAERVHEWTRMNAKGIDRVRTTGTEECDFWAPLGESSF